MSLLLLFIDGIGVGEDNPETNPFAAISSRRLAPVTGRAAEPGCCFSTVDATLGVDGMPQSPTGQTTLLTGVNAAQHAGSHLLGLPGPTLRPLLEEESLFLKLVRAGLKPTFANAYTRSHLEARRPRWSASTRAVMAAGIPFRFLDPHAREGRALFHDYAGEWSATRKIEAPTHDAESAAQVLCDLLDRHDFVMYEYFLTDLAGHRGTPEQQVDQARLVEQLVDAVVSRIRPSQTLLVTSDHGNLEEISHTRHTKNPIPVMAWGARAEPLVGAIGELTDVTPAIVNQLSGAGVR